MMRVSSPGGGGSGIPIHESRAASAMPTTVPAAAPSRPSTTPSMTNCASTSRRVAPSAIAVPISLVRSSTDIVIVLEMPSTISSASTSAIAPSWRPNSASVRR